MDAATMSLEKVLASGQYEPIKDVPVFDEHDEPITEEAARKMPLFAVRENGQWIRRFDRKALEYIARRCNERIRLTGDLGLFGPGHTIPDQYREGILVRKVPETDQPPPWGFIANWKVGHFGPAEKLAILVDLYAHKDHRGQVDTFPRRSVELWLNDGTIDWIALLRRTPRRDLGLLINHRRGPCLRYSMEDAMADPTAPVPDSNEPSPEESKQYDRMWAHFMKQPLMQYMNSCYEKANQQPAAPAPAAPAPAAGPQKEPPPKEPTQMSREEAEKLARYEREIADKDQRLAVLERENRMGRYERELGQLAAELQKQYSFALDVKTELADCKDLAPEQFEKHKAVLRRCAVAASDPSRFTSDIPVLDKRGSDDPDVITEQHFKMACQYQRDHDGVEWEDALEKTKSRAAAAR